MGKRERGERKILTPKHIYWRVVKDGGFYIFQIKHGTLTWYAPMDSTSHKSTSAATKFGKKFVETDYKRKSLLVVWEHMT